MYAAMLFLSLATAAAIIAQNPAPAPTPAPPAAPAQTPADLAERLKRDALANVEGRAAHTQELVDQLFSYAELGFQETESSKYMVGLLRKVGFTVQEGIMGIPTAWVATWGSGKPVISLGSDIDGIPQASQYPGVACRLPMVEGGPGHGEGHNSGLAVAVTAALAVKALMQREKLSGTIQI